MRNILILLFSAFTLLYSNSFNKLLNHDIDGSIQIAKKNILSNNVEDAFLGHMDLGHAYILKGYFEKASKEYDFCKVLNERGFLVDYKELYKAYPKKNKNLKKGWKLIESKRKEWGSHRIPEHVLHKWVNFTNLPMSEIEKWVELDINYLDSNKMETLEEAKKWVDAGLRESMFNWSARTGQSFEEAKKWLDVGITNEYSVLALIEGGITPQDVLEWNNYGMHGKIIGSWVENGIRYPEEASKWSKIGESPYSIKLYFLDHGIYSSDKVKKWLDIGMKKEMIPFWVNSGYTVDEVEKWLDIGVKKYQVYDCLELKLTRKEIKTWLDIGVHCQDISSWKDSTGISVDEVRKWINIGINQQYQITKWLKSGIILAEAKKWKEAGFSTLNEVKEMKEQSLNPNNIRTKDIKIKNKFKYKMVGFKGIYLQMPIDVACRSLSKAFKNEVLRKINNGCYIGNASFKKAQIISKQGKVIYIGVNENDIVHGTNELFNTQDLDYKQFAKAFVNNYDWIDNLDYVLVNKETMDYRSKIVPSYCSTVFQKKYKLCIDAYKNIELKYINKEPSFN